MEEIKQVLAQLNSALSLLQKRQTEVEKVSQDQESKAKGFAEVKDAQDLTAKDLNEREINVKHIESISDAIEMAKSISKQAQIDGEAIDKRREEFNVEINREKKALAKEQKAVEQDKIANESQAKALTKERTEFDIRVAAFKSLSKI